MLGQPLFPGESGIDQLVEIIKVLGTPTRDQIRTMNPNYMEHKFPQIKPHPFNKVFRKASPEAIELISALLEYTPTQRLSAIDAMVQPFFDELRDPSTRLPDSRHAGGNPRELPALFDFSRHGWYTFADMYLILIECGQSSRSRLTLTASLFRHTHDQFLHHGASIWTISLHFQRMR